MAKDTQAIFSALMESRNSKRTATNKVLENIKPAQKRAVKENVSPVSESFDGTSMFTGIFLKENLNAPITEDVDTDNEDVVDDIVDNITVVTDPDKTVDELETRADDIQDAIDNTPEGAAAFSDEYVGDKVYSCPICGESFFAEDDYKPGDVCPICKAEPQDGFLMNGVVSAVNPEDEATPETEEDAEVPADDITTDISEETEEPESEPATEEPETAEESLRAKTECNDNSIEVNTGDVAIEVTIKDNEPEEESPVCAEPECAEVDLDDESFNEVMDDFVEENYSECLESLHVTEAAYIKDRDVIELRCEAITKSGGKVPVKFELTERLNRNGRSRLLAKEVSNAFKIESTEPAFRFNVVQKNDAIVCESMAYGYTTVHSKAGKVKVEGISRRSLKK